MPTDPSREQPSPADLDPYYRNAAVTAARLGMPPGTLWASVWTPTEVRKSDRGVEVYLLLATMLEPDAAVSMHVPYAELRTAEGFALKMLGAVTSDPSPTSWIITAPPMSPAAGSFLAIEPWLLEVPIRGPGPTVPNSQPDAVAVRQRGSDGQIVGEGVHYVPGHPRPSGKLIDRAMAVLDIRVWTGRPADDSEAVRLEYLAAAREIVALGDPLTRDALAERTGLTHEWTYKRMRKHGVSIAGLKRALRES